MYERITDKVTSCFDISVALIVTECVVDNFKAVQVKDDDAEFRDSLIGETFVDTLYRLKLGAFALNTGQRIGIGKMYS